MFRRRTFRHLLFVVAGLAAPTAAGAEVAVPADWLGDWRMTIEYTAAGATTPHLTETVTDSICPGDVFGLGRLQPVVECVDRGTGTNRLAAQCTGSFSHGTCAGSAALQLDLQLSGPDLAGTSTVTATNNGHCAAPSFLDTVTVTGTRLSTTPSVCPAPATVVDKFLFLPELHAMQRGSLVVAVPTAGTLGLGLFAAVLLAAAVLTLRRGF